MSWLSELFGGSSGSVSGSLPTAAQMNALALQNVAFERAKLGDAGFKQRYGNLTDQQILNYGFPLTVTGEGGAFSPELQSIVEQSRSPATTPDVGAPPVTPPPDVPATPAGYSGPSAREEIDALLPSGFENTLLTSGAIDPFVTEAQGRNRSEAQKFIANALKRGTLTEAGSRTASEDLARQDIAANKAVSDFGANILETGRNRLRTAANIGREAAGSQTGEFFDPSQYKTGVDKELAAFTGGLGETFKGAPSKLYDLTSLLTAGGGVTGPQNLAVDPYAVAGGQLSTGLEEEPSPEDVTGKKKRTTAIF